MADNIRLITFSAQTVKAVNDANVYEAALGPGGVKYGCVVTASAAASNVLHITAGNGVICGRAFEVFETDIPIQLSGAGTMKGRVYLHMDLSNAAEPIQIMTETGSSLTPPIQQEDVNVTNGIYEINLATFEVTTSAIANVVNAKKGLDIPRDVTDEVEFISSNGGAIRSYSAIETAGLVIINGVIVTTREITNGSLQLGNFRYKGKNLTKFSIGTTTRLYYGGQNTDNECSVWNGYVQMIKRSTNIPAGTSGGFTMMAVFQR